MNKKNFTNETMAEIFERDNYACRICKRTTFLEKIPHHIFWKSQLFRECVSHASNGAVSCINCHKIIHHASTDAEVKQSKVYDKQLKQEALVAFEGKIPEEDYEELIKIYKSRGYTLQEQLSTGCH